MDYNGKLHENVGSVITKENRCITFSNINQHQVQPFELDDKTKKGSRKILVFFLVDPFSRIISTARVPPQQSDWLMEGLAKLSPFNKLPKEVLDIISEYNTWPMSLEDAKKYRQDLMDERKIIVGEINNGLFEREFSLCEH